MNPFKKIRELELSIEDYQTIVDKLIERIDALEDILDVERVYQPTFVYQKRSTLRASTVGKSIK